jgi:hypothetical protein
MSDDIKTIRDKEDGKVWTGAVKYENDILETVLTAGMNKVVEALVGSEPDVTVVVNGTEHTGPEIKPKT